LFTCSLLLKAAVFYLSQPVPSLRSWQNFARECFCFGGEAVNTRGEAVRGLVKSRVEFPRKLREGIWRLRCPLARSRIPSATQASLFPKISHINYYMYLLLINPPNRHNFLYIYQLEVWNRSKSKLKISCCRW